jgi:S1-C subfamily serine protease
MTKILKIEYSIKRVSILFIQLSLLSIAFLLLSYSSAFSRTAYESFADLVDEISPAVVNITTTKEENNAR